MKKIICMLLIATLMGGCSSKNTDENHVGGEGVNILNLLAYEDDNDKVVEKDTKNEEKNEDKNDTNIEDSKKTESNETSKPSNESSNNTGNNGGTTQEPSTPTPTPPKEETPVPKPETPPVVDPTPAPPVNQQAMAQQVFAQINAYRQQNGKEPFALSSFLQGRSETHALAMATREALWHSGAAECITNYDDPFDAWKNSPAHNEMLLSNNTVAAVAIYYYNGYYYSVFQSRYQ